jgi:hypothetical protein
VLGKSLEILFLFCEHVRALLVDSVSGERNDELFVENGSESARAADMARHRQGLKLSLSKGQGSSGKKRWYQARAREGLRLSGTIYRMESGWFRGMGERTGYVVEFSGEDNACARYSPRRVVVFESDSRLRRGR